MINIGWIGCGRHARQMLLPQLGRNDIRIAALCDRDGAALERTGTEYGVSRLCSDFRELIATPGLDAIGMAVGPELHRAASIAALEAGLPVFMEKPPRRHRRGRPRGRPRRREGGQAGDRRLHEALFHRQPDRDERGAEREFRRCARHHRRLYDRPHIFRARARLHRLLPASLRALHGPDPLVRRRGFRRHAGTLCVAAAGQTAAAPQLHHGGRGDRQRGDGHSAIARHANGGDPHHGRSRAAARGQHHQCRALPRPPRSRPRTPPRGSTRPATR
ncbi:Gfo/Idh/MocA family protein [Alloyangia mangrovi]|uniref:Gfo/Idh/MocA family protein n=1 Tax=Alloyangia mangrovi TaxID=1779329 RepID=UPI00288BBACB|nr:Gfo/Idh/MocA family oxidoreductase [Alloyangia mangrovi]